MCKHRTERRDTWLIPHVFRWEFFPPISKYFNSNESRELELITHFIIRSRSPSSRSGPERCWETTEDVYRKPGSWTDSEKEYRLRSARSEGARTPSCSEKNLDNLYLKAASQSKLDRTYSQVKPREKLLAAKDKVINYSSSRSSPLIRETLLAVQMNYSSSAISVFKGDVVTLLGRKEIRDINSKKPRQWFYVRSRSGTEAFIPAEVAGHGYL